MAYEQNGTKPSSTPLDVLSSKPYIGKDGQLTKAGSYINHGVMWVSYPSEFEAQAAEFLAVASFRMNLDSVAAPSVIKKTMAEPFQYIQTEHVMIAVTKKPRDDNGDSGNGQGYNNGNGNGGQQGNGNGGGPRQQANNNGNGQGQRNGNGNNNGHGNYDDNSGYDGGGNNGGGYQDNGGGNQRHGGQNNGGQNNGGQNNGGGNGNGGGQRRNSHL
jgi:hypothetical protein